MSTIGGLSLQRVIQDIEQNRETVRAPSSERDRWSRILASQFEKYTVWNWTDFTYDKCHSYEILLHPGKFQKPGSRDEERVLISQLGGHLYALELMLSVVAPYYIIKLVHLTADEQIPKAETPQPDQQKFIKRAERLVERHGFQKLPREYFDHPMPNIDLELAPKGKATIFNCLFTDTDLPSSAVW